MTFAAEFDAKIIDSWRIHGLCYNDINNDLKRCQNEVWLDQDEREFETKLSYELAKVCQFITRQLDSLKTRLDAAEQQLKLASTGNETVYDRVADTTTEILLEINDVSRFQQANTAGFDRLIKKHDRMTHRNLMLRYKRTLLMQWPLDYQPALDVLIVRLSQLHAQCRLRGMAHQDLATTDKDETQFERATDKYWVHPDNIAEVKAILLFHLPVHVYKSKTPYDTTDAAISSVYVDNPALDLYSERLERVEGAEAIRLRWYGTEKDHVYVERKTHKAPWMNGHSIKDRFKLQEDQVDRFLHGQYSPETYCNDLQARNNLNVKAMEQRRFVCEGIQQSIRQRQLHPVCRVFYHRTAFQHPDDPRLRLSLDCNMTFVREDNLDGKHRRPHQNGLPHWRRTDVGVSDYPFRRIDPRDVAHFPYAVLETKIQTHRGQDIPDWLAALLSSHLVHPVPRFSKYLHGAAQLYSDRVPVKPWWLAELDKDIRKSPLAPIGLSRSRSLQPLINGHHRRSLTLPSPFSKQVNPWQEPVPHVSIRLVDQPAIVTTTSPPQPRHRWLGRIYSIFNQKKTDKERLNKALCPARTVPMKRTEPKTFFANERTFINWLQFCALMLTVALNLLNNGDRISRLIGAAFIIIASLLSFYALGRFQFRAWQLRTGRTILRFDDLYGPTVLCVILVTALAVNFYLRAPSLVAASDP